MVRNHRKIWQESDGAKHQDEQERSARALSLLQVLQREVFRWLFSDGWPGLGESWPPICIFFLGRPNDVWPGLGPVTVMSAMGDDAITGNTSSTNEW